MKGFIQVCLLLLSVSCFAKLPSQSAIASSHPLVTQAGIDVLNQDGNAFDAAMAMAAVLVALEPQQKIMNGTWVLHDARKEPNDIVFNASVLGDAAGLVYLSQQYGKLSPSVSLAPALKIAKNNSIISDLNKITASQAQKNYQIKQMKPLVGEYKDLKIISAPHQSVVGVLAALKILADFELQGLSDADKKHLIIESLRRVNCDVLNQDLDKIDPELILSDENIEKLRASIKMNRATPLASMACPKLKEAPHSSYYLVLDKQGNHVAASFVPSAKNTFSAPMIFEMKEGHGSLGTSGADQEPAVLLLSLLTAMDDYFPQTWMLTPRYYQAFSEDVVKFEKGAFPVPLQNALRLRGHQLKQIDSFGDLQGLFWDTQTNKVYVASDPRGKGLAKTL